IKITTQTVPTTLTETATITETAYETLSDQKAQALADLEKTGQQLKTVQEELTQEQKETTK
ncbi:6680_t:CDS:1, partial [Funneliformis geosporum]